LGPGLYYKVYDLLAAEDAILFGYAAKERVKASRNLGLNTYVDFMSIYIVYVIGAPFSYGDTNGVLKIIMLIHSIPYFVSCVRFI